MIDPKTLALIQGLFYVITGIWPLVSMRTFEFVTGPKRDHWLVRAIGLMITVSGVVFLYSGLSTPPIPIETVILAVGNALVLAGVDIFYSSIGRISKIYLADAAVEIVIAGLWLLSI